MIRPVTAMITFFPTDESHSSHSRFMTRVRSRVHHRLGRAHRFGRFAELLPFGVGQSYLEDLLQTTSTQLAGHAAEDVPQAELSLQPGGAWQDSFLVERNGLDHLHRGGTGRI